MRFLSLLGRVPTFFAKSRPSHAEGWVRWNLWGTHVRSYLYSFKGFFLHFYFLYVLTTSGDLYRTSGIAYLFILYSLWLLYYNLILTISIHTYVHCVRVYVEASSSKPRTSFWRGYVIVCQTFDSRHHSRLPVASHAPPRWRHPSKGFILDRNSTSGKI